MAKVRKPRLALWKFTSCGGCQLVLLNCERELLALSESFEIANFQEASSRSHPGPFDLSLVEGSITTAEEVRRLLRIRKRSRFLAAIGACAVSGGLQAFRNQESGGVERFLAAVYEKPAKIHVLPDSTPLRAHVSVDFELRGCPIDRVQLLESLSAFVHDRKPRIPEHSLCMECKALGYVCVMVSAGIPCLGQVTQAGCGALCPSVGRGCYGCFGRPETLNPLPVRQRWTDLGADGGEFDRALTIFGATAEEGTS
jgi:sulfhydrogenase subunit delta